MLQLFAPGCLHRQHQFRQCFQPHEKHLRRRCTGQGTSPPAIVSAQEVEGEDARCLFFLNLSVLVVGFISDVLEDVVMHTCMYG